MQNRNVKNIAVLILCIAMAGIFIAQNVDKSIHLATDNYRQNEKFFMKLSGMLFQQDDLKGYFEFRGILNEKEYQVTRKNTVGVEPEVFYNISSRDSLDHLFITGRIHNWSVTKADTLLYLLHKTHCTYVRLSYSAAGQPNTPQYRCYDVINMGYDEGNYVIFRDALSAADMQLYAVMIKYKFITNRVAWIIEQ